jgi:hypothetical protein
VKKHLATIIFSQDEKGVSIALIRINDNYTHTIKVNILVLSLSQTYYWEHLVETNARHFFTYIHKDSLRQFLVAV